MIRVRHLLNIDIKIIVWFLTSSSHLFCIFCLCLITLYISFVNCCTMLHLWQIDNALSQPFNEEKLFCSLILWCCIIYREFVDINFYVHVIWEAKGCFPIVYSGHTWSWNHEFTFVFYFVVVLLQIFISRDGGNKNFASVLAPGQHEGLG